MAIKYETDPKRHYAILMKFLLGIIVCIFGMTYLAEAQELTVLTTTWAPYSYEENGNITGLA